MFERTKHAVVQFFYMLLFIAIVAGLGYVAYCNWSHIVTWDSGLTGRLRLIVGIIMTLSLCLGFVFSKNGISGFGLLFGIIFTAVAFATVMYFKLAGLTISGSIPYALVSLGIYYVTIILRIIGQKAS